MVNNNRNIGFASDSCVVHDNRWHSIRHKELARPSTGYIGSVVWTSSVLVSISYMDRSENISWRSYYSHRYFLPESPRWLLAKGRTEELKEIIETAAKWNRIKLPNNYDKILNSTVNVEGDDDSNGSFYELFRGEYLRTTLLLVIAWFTLILQYMAMTLHIGEMGGDIYLTTVSLF